MNNFSKEDKTTLLDVAKQSIKYGIRHGEAMPIDLSNYPNTIAKNGASFVTLELNGDLRGCIGSLEAYQPLVTDIAKNAFAAAFLDPRFTHLTEKEYQKITIHISVLSEPQPMSFSSEDDLLKQLRPSIDGLILTDLGQTGTFLPAVWESLPNPKDFLLHLKMKAGFQPNYWSKTLQIKNYVVEVID